VATQGAENFGARKLRAVMPGLAATVRSTAQRAGEALYRTADGISRAPFIRERYPLPGSIQVGQHKIDTIEDLVAFTGLDRETVVQELQRRRRINFRNEWLATPRLLRSDRWFYFSSKAYLFANASHFPDDSFVRDFVRDHVGADARVLEFGGGTGELTLRLAGAGIATTFIELNSLQRDFVSFRVARHDLSDLVTVLPHWAPVPPEAFDAVITVDVLEHLPDARAVLSGVLLPALRPDGVLIENSPFEVNASNPMHHNDFGLTGSWVDSLLPSSRNTSTTHARGVVSGLAPCEYVPVQQGAASAAEE